MCSGLYILPMTSNRRTDVTSMQSILFEKGEIEIVLKEDNSGSYSHFLWPSSVTLCLYFLGKDFRANEILEIGCGVGLVSILLSRIGCRNIVASDAEVNSLLRHNIASNEVQRRADRSYKNNCEIKILELDWNDNIKLNTLKLKKHFQNDQFPFGINHIVSSDIFYDSKGNSSLHHLIKRF